MRYIMNFLMFLRENTIVSCSYMFSSLLMLTIQKLLALPVFPTPSPPQNSQSLNQHKALLVTTSCWIFFLLKFKFSIQNPRTNLYINEQLFWLILFMFLLNCIKKRSLELSREIVMSIVLQILKLNCSS